MLQKNLHHMSLHFLQFVKYTPISSISIQKIYSLNPTIHSLPRISETCRYIMYKRLSYKKNLNKNEKK